jgi:hypothetical protein
MLRYKPYPRQVILNVGSTKRIVNRNYQFKVVSHHTVKIVTEIISVHYNTQNYTSFTETARTADDTNVHFLCCFLHAVKTHFSEL